MKRIPMIVVCLLSFQALTLPAAESAGQEFVGLYAKVRQADELFAQGQEREALAVYLDAYKGLRQLQRESPLWNPEVVSFRVSDTAEKVLALQARYPEGGAPPVSLPVTETMVATTPAPVPATPMTPAPIPAAPAPVATPETSVATPDTTTAEIMILREQVEQLRRDGAAATEVDSLKRELGEQKDLVAVMNDEVNTLLPDLVEQESLNEQLRAQVQGLQLQLSQATANSAAANELFAQVSSLQSENSSLRTQLSVLEQASIDQPASIPVNGGMDRAALADLQSQNASLQQEKQALEARLASMNAINAAPASAPDTAAMSALQSELSAAQQSNQEMQAALAEAKAASMSTEPSRERDQQRIEKLEAERNELKAMLKLSEKASSVRDANKIEKLEAERDYFERQLAEANTRMASSPSDQARVRELTSEVQALQAKIQALETQKAAASSAVSSGPAASFPVESSASVSTPDVATPAPAVAEPVAVPAPAPMVKPEPIMPEEASPSLSIEDLLKQAEQDYASSNIGKAEQGYQAAAAKTDDLTVLSNLSATQIEQEKFDEAEPNIRKVLAASPNDSVALFQLGYIQYRKGEFPTAEATLRKAASVDPKDSEIQNYLGIVLSSQNRRDEAEETFRKALILAPGNASAHHNLAVLYATQQPALPELAQFHYDKALRAGHPRNENLESKIAELKAK